MTNERNKKARKSINFWLYLYEKLKEIEEDGGSMWKSVERCLTSEVNLNDILEERGINGNIYPCRGRKITTLSFHLDVINKIDEISNIVPSFSVSTIVNLSLMFREINVYSILERTGREEPPNDSGGPIPEHILDYVRNISGDKEK